MIKRLLDAVDERIGHRRLLDEALDEPIPGGASWAYVFGSAALLLFLVQLFTGVVLALYYSPSSTDAWASVSYLEREITMGALVRGLHHHSAGGMVVIVVLHMLQVVWFGAYRAPREANWLAGLALFGLVLAFALTGYLLPWDQTGYWATKVATSIAGTVPLVGPMIQRIAQGGNDYGNLTLTRFYALHVVVLPLLTLGLIGVHVALFRKHGVTPSAATSDAELTKRTDTFWPKQVMYDAIFFAFVLAAMFALALRFGAPLEAPADPGSNFIARPEWYFLFLFQLLKYFEGPLQIVGTVILPGIATAFLAALPFLDRKKSRRVRDRAPFVALVGLGIAFAALLSFLAIDHDRHDTTIAVQKKRAKREAERALALAAKGVPAAGATYMMAQDPLTRGERVFVRECMSCHALEGVGPKERKAPDLSGYLSRAWIRQVLIDPDSKRLFGGTKVEGMKSFHDLPKENLEKLIDIVYAQRDPKAPAPEERPGGNLLSELECTNCHDFEDWYGLEGPSLFKYGTAEWIGKVIDDPESDVFYGAPNEMPAFAERLPKEDRDALVAFLLSLEARADPSAWPFVDDQGPIPTPRVQTSTSGSSGS
jgi:ubiquinol-cytochrome c reductase cytochrome b subunit